MTAGFLTWRDIRTPALKTSAQDIEDRRVEVEYCRRVRENIKARVLANPRYLKELRA